MVEQLPLKLGKLSWTWFASDKIIFIIIENKYKINSFVFELFEKVVFFF